MEQPIGIIGAMAVEVEALLEAAENVKTEKHAGMEFHTGKLSGVPCVVAHCFPGKVNSAVCAQVMADFYNPRAILNIGVAGGIGPEVHIGDVVIASACVEYDFDGTALGSSLGEMDVPSQKEPITEFPCDAEISQKLLKWAKSLYGGVHSGMIATGDRFVADPEEGRRLYGHFGALACEMEGGSIAHTCLINGIPCAVLRSISDNANDDASVDFPTFARESAHKAQKLLTGVIGSL